MGFPVILTTQSQADLGSIVRYIARDSPDRAEAFGYLLIDKALSIGTMPEQGRVVLELNEPSVREIIHGLVPDNLRDLPRSDSSCVTILARSPGQSANPALNLLSSDF